ncbi:MAG: hypothetical protein RLZZ04_4925 [Cyanobacteriota bacterium]|jgi:hypothetical protein
MVLRELKNSINSELDAERSGANPLGRTPNKPSHGLI